MITLSDNFISTDGLILTSDGKEVVFCYGKYDTYAIPDGVEQVDDMAGAEARVSSLIAPNSVKVIGGCSFSFCDDLLSVCLKGIERIGETAFAHCDNLKHVRINSSIKELGECAFTGCPAIEDFCFVDDGGNEKNDGDYRVLTTFTKDPETHESAFEYCVCMLENLPTAYQTKFKCVTGIWKMQD